MTRRDGTFFQQVYALVCQVPRGRVVTYGQLATLLGVERGARAVGWALRALGAEQARAVPWHRVVGHGGRVSLGSSPAGLEQHRRLRQEGVLFLHGRVDLARHGLQPAARRSPRRSSTPRARRPSRR